MDVIEKQIKKLKRLKTIEEKIAYIKEIIEPLNYEDKIIIIDYLIEKVKMKYSKINSLKKQYQKYFKTNKNLKSCKELGPLKEFKKALKILKEDLKFEESTKDNNKKYYYPSLTLNEDQLLKITTLLDSNTYDLIKKLDQIECIGERLKILNELKTNIEKYFSDIKDKNITEIENIKLVKILYTYVNSAIRIEHKKQKVNSKNKIDEEIEEYVLTENQQKILENMKNNQSIEYYDIEEILIAYKELISKDVNKYSKNILKYSKIISLMLMENIIDNDNTINMIFSVRDTIKYKLMGIDKSLESNKLEITVLKELRIIFDFISKNYKEDISKTNHDYCYDVIKYFLEEEEGYPYIKKIINDLPSIVNTKNDGEHILITLLKEYIYNYKKMLKDKTSDFINPDYIKQVYLLFAHSYKLKLTVNEREAINNHLNQFLLYLKDNVYNLDRQKEIKKEISKLETGYFFYEKEPKYKNVDKSQLLWQAKTLKSNKESSLNRNNRKDLIEDEVISFNDTTAYSLNEYNNIKQLKIHVLDLASIVVKNTSVDSQVYNDMIEQKDIHYQIKRNLCLEENTYNPTITYEIIFDNNEVIDFNIYRSKIIIDEKCIQRDLTFKKNNTLNNIVSLVKKQAILNNEEINLTIDSVEKQIEKILNNEFIKYISKNNIPFIYSGVEYINDYINNMNNLNATFNRLNPNEFNVLYKIINDNVGEFCYSVKPFEVDGEYNLNLINEINYLSIENQRLIVDIILNKEEIKTKEKYIKEYNSLEHELNLSINHISPDDIKFKNKRKRNKLKEYNL